MWRYLVQDTIEVKIDRKREEHQDESVEDALYAKKSATTIQAGGIDGGFHSNEELMDLLRLDDGDDSRQTGNN